MRSRNMKRVLLTLVVSAASILSSVAQIDYVIEGNVDKYSNDRYIYLQRLDSNRKAHKLDSAYVKNNKFTFKGSMPNEEILELNDGYASMNVLIEKGIIKVDMDKKKNLGTTFQNKIMDQYESSRDSIQMITGQRLGLLSDDSVMTKEQREAERKKVLKDYSDGFYSLAKQYLENYGSMMIAEYIMDRATVNLGEDTLKFDSLFELVKRKDLSYEPLKADVKRYEAIKNTSAGKMFVDFTIDEGTKQGGRISLSDYVGKGKYVLLDFWASWCFWCRAEFPIMADLYKKYRGDHFEIVGLAVKDKREDTDKALAEDKIVEWPIIYNGGNSEMNKYGVWGIPQIILFAPDGTIVERGLRNQHLVEVVEREMKQYE